MVRYTGGGRRDTRGTVDAITKGTANIIQAQMGYAQQLNALGESVGGNIANIGGVIAKAKQRREQYEFETAQLSQKQAGDLERQREGIQGQKEIEGVRQKGRLEAAGEQAQARSEAATVKAKRDASKDPNIAYDEGTGSFKSTEMGKRSAATDFNIKRRQKTVLDQKIAQYHKDAANLDRKRMLASETDKRDFDFKMEKHTAGYIQNLHNERRKLVQGNSSSWLMGLAGDDVDAKTPEGIDELLRRSYELEKATAFDYAGRTGDDKFIPRSSPEYTEYLQMRKPVTDMLMSMPALQAEGSRRDAGWMQRKANMLGAQLFMMTRNNPRMREMMQFYQAGGGGVGQQPGAGAGAAGGGQVPPGDGANGAGAGVGPR